MRQIKGVPASPSGHSAEPEPSYTVSAVPVSVPNAQAFTIRQPPMLCEIGNDGSVRWTEHASPHAIMEEMGNAALNLGLLALWYATNGENRPASADTHPEGQDAEERLGS